MTSAVGPQRLHPLAPWRRAGFDDEEAVAWKVAGIVDPGKASRWKQVGIEDPKDLPDGIEYPEAWRFVIEAGVPRTPEWAALWGPVVPEVAAAGYRAGQPPQAVLAFARAVSPQGAGVWRWPDPAAVEMVNRAYEAYSLDWFDVAACITVGGLSAREAIEHLESGADVGPWRLVAALGG